MNVGNGLHEEVLGPDTVTMFKRLLDRYWDRKSVEGYMPNVGKWDQCM